MRFMLCFSRTQSLLTLDVVVKYLYVNACSLSSEIILCEIVAEFKCEYELTKSKTFSLPFFDRCIISILLSIFD